MRKFAGFGFDARNILSEILIVAKDGNNNIFTIPRVSGFDDLICGIGHHVSLRSSAIEPKITLLFILPLIAVLRRTGRIRDIHVDADHHQHHQCKKKMFSHDKNSFFSETISNTLVKHMVFHNKVTPPLRNTQISLV